MPEGRDIRSRFRLSFETEGTERVKRAVGDVNKALGKKALGEGMSELDRLTARNMRQMAGLSKHLRDVTKSLGGLGRAAKQVGKLADDLKRAGRNAKSTGDEVRRTAAEMRRGAFAQGFGQGIGLGPFLQRGPGMGRQAMGVMAGGAVRGLAASPVQGAQAIAQGLASIPGGGIVTAMMANAFASFQAAAAREQAVTALGGPGRANVAAGRRAFRRVMSEQFVGRPLPTAIPSGRGIHTPEGAFADEAEFMAVRDLRVRQLRAAGQFRQAADLERRTFQDQQRQTLKAMRERQARRNAEDRQQFEADRQRRAEQAQAVAARTPAMRIQQTGLRFGLTPEQSLRMAEQMGLSGLDPTLGIGARSAGALLGFQRLGFGAAEAGAFVRGERRGGIEGVGRAPGGAGRAIDETLGRMLAMGLDRSEMKQLMSQLVAGQERFFTTGVPFARSSILDLAEGLGAALGPGARSLRTAQAIAAGTQMVGAEGPTNAAQTLLVRQIARSRGFGMTAEGIAGALQSLEEQPATPEELQQLLGVARVPGGALGAQIRRRFLGQAIPGLQITAREAGRLGDVGLGRPETRGARVDVGRMAQRIVSPIEQRRALQEAERVRTGMRLAPAVQQFESNIIRGGAAFGELAPTVLRIAQGGAEIVELLPKLTSQLQQLVDRLGDVRNSSGGGG